MESTLEILRKYTGGQQAAILHKICGGDEEKLDALLRDELEVQLVKRILKLVDKNGRIILRKGLENAVCDPDNNFRLNKQRLETLGDFGSRLIRFQESFKSGLCLSVAEFQGKAGELIKQISDNKNIANLLKGIFLPIVLPRLEDVGDYGKILEQIFLSAVKLAYEKEFPGRKFYNYRENDLADKVSVVSGTRHEKLLERMTNEFVVAIYFPSPLQGFSPLASREQMAILPESLLLTGGFDTVAAMTMYPDILARDWNTPGLDMSALTWQSPGCSLYFEADDDDLGFGSRGSLGVASDDYSSGVLFLGSA